MRLTTKGRFAVTAMIDLGLRSHAGPVALAAIKAEPDFADLALIRQSRLSVMPVSAEHWKKLCRMGGWKG